MSYKIEKVWLVIKLSNNREEIMRAFRRQIDALNYEEDEQDMAAFRKERFRSEVRELKVFPEY